MTIPQSGINYAVTHQQVHMPDVSSYICIDLQKNNICYVDIFSYDINELDNYFWDDNVIISHFLASLANW